MNKDRRLYITRSIGRRRIEVWPATVGIRKFKDAYFTYGAAWCSSESTGCLYKNGKEKECNFVKCITIAECYKRYGVKPKQGYAYYINEKGKAIQQHLDFTK